MNTQITDTLVSFDNAILLKEKEFACSSDDCYWSYLEPNMMAMQYDESTCVLMPTQSLAQKWLREVHNIDVLVYKVKKKYTTEYCTKHYNTYEQALEEALQEALKLIK